MPLSISRYFSRDGYGAVETFVVVAVVSVLIFVVVTHYAKNLDQSRETALRSEIATLRNTVNLFRAVNGRCPEKLSEILTAEYALPFKAGPTEITKDEAGNLKVENKALFNPEYLRAYALDQEGNIVDPFGVPYAYDPAQCTVHTVSSGYEEM